MDKNKDKYTNKNRLFLRNLDEGKMYTHRYVRRLKVAHDKLMNKFTLGSKYALRAQKHQIMTRATRLVVDSHKKLMDTFENEALTLLYQTRIMQEELAKKTNQCDILIKANREQELDLACILR